MGINESTLRHHLKSLQTVERIKVKQVGKYNYYYPFDYNDSITLTPIQKEIVNKIRNEDGITTLSLATFLDKERQTIQYHIHDLTEKGIIKSDKKGNKLYWYINDESLSELKS